MTEAADLNATVAGLLTESMVAHQAAWEHRRAGRTAEAKVALQTAYDKRLGALKADPLQTADVWRDVVTDGPNKGVHLHDDLMRFYRLQLGV